MTRRPARAHRTALAATGLGVLLVAAGCGWGSDQAGTSGSAAAPAASSTGAPAASSGAPSSAPSGSAGSSSAGSGSAGSSSAPAGGGGSDANVSIALNADPGNLNPYLSTANDVRVITPFVYDNLVYFDQKTGEAKPWLAEKWTTSPTKLTFTLKKGITCADGSSFTAGTAANAINWNVNPANKSALTGVLVPADAKATADEASNTLTVTLKDPNSFALTQLGSLEMVCQKGLDDPKSLESASDGTGLFQVSKVLAGDSYVVTRRDGYSWGPDGGNTSDTPGVPRTVTFTVSTNESTRANLLLSGQLNIAGVGGPDEDRVAARTTAIAKTPFIVGQLYWSQLQGKPTADKAVRIALTQALDLDALAQVATAGKGYRAQRLAMMTPNPCPYDAATPSLPKHDVEAAKAALDAAGWVAGADGTRSKGGKPLALTLIYSQEDSAVAASMDLVRQQLAAVGVQVTLQGSDTNAFLAKLYGDGTQSSFDVANQTVNINFPSILTPWNSGPMPPNGRNATNVNNAEYDSYVKKALALSDQASCGDWQKSEEALFSAADSVPFAAKDTVTYGTGVTLALEGYVGGASVRVAS